MYVVSVMVFTFVVPVVGATTECALTDTTFTFEVLAKWFIFSAVGLRLLLAGIKQTSDPAFTAKQIFHIEGQESFPILRELGFANICFGLVGIVSMFMVEWRLVSAFGSGLYYGFAGLQHLIKRPAGVNEKFALWTDLVIFVALFTYFLVRI